MCTFAPLLTALCARYGFAAFLLTEFDGVAHFNCPGKDQPCFPNGQSVSHMSSAVLLCHHACHPIHSH